LPDPTVGLNVFAIPIETASGSQRGNLNVMQMIPWLSRLNAQEQKAAYEALSMQQEYQAARLRVIADVRAAYYRLYVLGKQIEINEASLELLKSLIETATARVANGTATQGDVLLGTLELSRLEEQLVEYRQMVTSTTAELNRLRNRPAQTLVDVPERVDAPFPGWRHDELSRLAQRQQPEIAAAQLTTQAASWGLEVARRERRPNLSLGSTWFFIGDNRPNSRVVAVGEDAWSIGATVSIPLSHRKYDAMEQEAVRKQFAAQFAVDDVIRAYDARLQDLLAQARAADETARLYQDTILPQALQTLEADQQSYAQNTVEFDRVIADVRNLLTLELGYHRALGQLATSIARIQEAVGGDLPVSTTPLEPTPAPATDDTSVTNSGIDLSTAETAGHNESEVHELLELLSHEWDVSQTPLSPAIRPDDDHCPQRAGCSGGSSVLRGLRECLAPGAD
jgi:outer membrane protein TolC